MGYPNFKNKYFEKALFSPSDSISWSKYAKEETKNKPSKYILIYYPYLLNYFEKKYSPKIIKMHRLITIYRHKDIALVQMTGIGAPNATTVLEELISLGGNQFLNIGSCGGLKNFGIFLCEKALRDEGVSYHYLPHGKYSYPSKKLTSMFKKSLEKNNIDFEMGATWTIDAPYRETISEIKHYKQEGIKTVDMETSALFAVAEFRKVKMASCLVVSDILGEDKWDPQFDSKHVKQKLKKLIDIAIETSSI